MTTNPTPQTLLRAACLALACLCFPTTGFADGFLDDTLNYSFEPGSETSVSVSGLRNSSVSSLEIPATVEYEWTDWNDGNQTVKRRTCDVTRIGSNAFYNRSGLTSVTIPNSVTNIGILAFNNCSNLASVTIPDSVTSIGGWAFGDCRNLEALSLGSALTNIGERAFISCGKLDSVSVSIDNPMFRSVDGHLLTKDGTTLIRSKALRAMTIPDGVTSIRDSAFSGCSIMESVTIPAGVTNIGDYAFGECSSLAAVTIPDSVTSIGGAVFDGCDKLWASWYRTLANLAANGGGGSSGGSGGSPVARVSLMVTNVVLHYVTQSVPSGAVVPPATSGIVSVVTEVGAGGAIAISAEWAEQYPGFVAKFGSDFREAVTKPTGKRDGSGNPMFVWQDFVAGTDPTDPDDVFTASIAFNAETGDPVVSWSPELSATEAAKRVYRVFGKVRLNDSDWTLLDGNAADYNFFKVVVEMK